VDQKTLSAMAGHQLPWVSVLVPFWLVATFVFMEGGRWSDFWEVWPGMLVSGLSFALMQWYASGTNALHLVTDVVAGVFSVICTALFLRIWHPKTRFLLKSERGGAGASVPLNRDDGKYKSRSGQPAGAWTPGPILILCCPLWGMPAYKTTLNNLFQNVKVNTTLLGSPFNGTLSLPAWEMP